MTEPIDVVIPWVDGDDPEWLAEKRKYDPEVPLPDSGEHHFRDWGLLKYLFRGIERFMPWVRTVHFVTWGHLPEWLNVDCPKLHIVRHEDYIPKEYLPTFSSHVIELNFHRIDGLADQFIYFNDDMYVMKHVVESDFFAGGLPRDLAALNVHCYSLSRPIDLIQVSDVGLINEHFSFRSSIKGNWRKWFRLQNKTVLLRTIALLGCPRFPGFYQPHCPQSLLRSTFEEVWTAEYGVLDSTCHNPLRTPTDVNQWVMREWQIASGRFVPRNRGFFEPFYLDKENPIEGSRRIVDAILKQRYALICVNDAEMDDQSFTTARTRIGEAFDSLLPHTSAFELIGTHHG